MSWSLHVPAGASTFVGGLRQKCAWGWGIGEGGGQEGEGAAQHASVHHHHPLQPPSNTLLPRHAPAAGCPMGMSTARGGRRIAHAVAEGAGQGGGAFDSSPLCDCVCEGGWGNCSLHQHGCSAGAVWRGGDQAAHLVNTRLIPPQAASPPPACPARGCQPVTPLNHGMSFRKANGLCPTRHVVPRHATSCSPCNVVPAHACIQV